MGASGFDDGLPLGRLRGKRSMQMFQCRNKIGDRCFGSCDMRGGGEGVVGGLRHVDVIIGMYVHTGGLRDGCDDLVGVHVRTGSRAGLEDVDGELIVVLAFGDLVRGGDDCVGLVRVEESEVLVDLRTRCFQQAHCADLGALERAPADREVLDCTLGLCSPQCVDGHPNFAHGVVFDSELLIVALRHGSTLPLFESG